MRAVTVLLIDDNAVQMGIRKAVLARAGFDVLTADNAEAAFALLRCEPGSPAADVVVTDHLMPDVSGSGFVKRLREVDATLPVIVISGLPHAEEEYAAFNVHFRYKPCVPQELIELVNSLAATRAISATA